MSTVCSWQQTAIYTMLKLRGLNLDTVASATVLSTGIYIYIHHHCIEQSGYLNVLRVVGFPRYGHVYDDHVYIFRPLRDSCVDFLIKIMHTLEWCRSIMPGLVWSNNAAQ